VIEAARINNVKRVVYASSSSVYGDEMELPKREEKIGKCLSPYAGSKFIDEVYADIYRRCYGMEIIGLRYFNVFGPGQNPDGDYAAVIPKFIKSMIKGERIIINGDGNISRDFTFIDNVVDFNIRCFITENDEVFGKVFNVACGRSYSLNDLVEILSVIIGRVDVVYGEKRKGDIEHSLADIELGEKLLGYEPIVLFGEGLERTVRYFVTRV
jgi:UDP-N-acetylglucosamine 4-epimerase